MRFLAAVAVFLFSLSAFAFDETITVSWTDAGSEDSYQVQRNANTCALANVNSWTTIASPAADVLSFVDTVQDDADYCHRVRAIKDGVQGPWSVGVDINVPASLSAITVTTVLN